MRSVRLTGMSEPCIKRKKRDQLYTTQGRERVKRKVFKKAHGYTLRENRIVSRQVRNRLYDTHRWWNDYTSYSGERKEKEKEKSYLYKEAHGKQRTFEKFWHHLNLLQQSPRILQ